MRLPGEVNKVRMDPVEWIRTRSPMLNATPVCLATLQVLEQQNELEKMREVITAKDRQLAAASAAAASAAMLPAPGALTPGAANGPAAAGAAGPDASKLITPLAGACSGMCGRSGGDAAFPCTLSLVLSDCDVPWPQPNPLKGLFLFLPHRRHAARTRICQGHVRLNGHHPGYCARGDTRGAPSRTRGGGRVRVRDGVLFIGLLDHACFSMPDPAFTHLFDLTCRPSQAWLSLGARVTAAGGAPCQAPLVAHPQRRASSSARLESCRPSSRHSSRCVVFAMHDVHAAEPLAMSVAGGRVSQREESHLPSLLC